MRRAALAGGAALLYVWLAALPAWEAGTASAGGRDYASFHYAVAEAWEGSNPYDTRALAERARADGVRAEVHPFLYPPPFLLGMIWALPLDLPTAYRVLFWLNQAALLGSGALLWRWFGARPEVLALLAVTFTPVADTLAMGQVNLLVLLLVLAAFTWRRGEALGAAAMAKMFPALYLGLWAVQRRWKPVATALGTAVALSVLALPLVGREAQWRFYADVLPGFASGRYNDLTVPLTLPANHSIADLLNQWRPGPDPHTLHPTVGVLSAGIALAVLGALLLVARRRRDPMGQAALAGAFTALAVVTPVYAYEHHLAVLLLPLAVVGTALLDGRLRLRWALALAPAYLFLALPLSWLRAGRRAAPDLGWILQESKFLAVVTVGIGCVAVALNSPEEERSGRDPRPAPADPENDKAPQVRVDLEG